MAEHPISRWKKCAKCHADRNPREDAILVTGVLLDSSKRLARSIRIKS